MCCRTGLCRKRGCWVLWPSRGGEQWQSKQHCSGLRDSKSPKLLTSNTARIWSDSSQRAGRPRKHVLQALGNASIKCASKRKTLTALVDSKRDRRQRQLKKCPEGRQSHRYGAWEGQRSHQNRQHEENGIMWDEKAQLRDETCWPWWTGAKGSTVAALGRLLSFMGHNPQQPVWPCHPQFNRK